ncbi:hypothetical protein [Thauera sp.]|uniref:hypothetical protein n=1 Tax=unclassified Thauera TaxID=2609274 RepID=UPI002B7DC3F4|nr:hypothetical protein [Thauera sp.]HRP24979.1 hypothetical protein [Thauera sp.]HRP65039.1 hypothetical protein [Thauera sp.]
MSTRKPTAERTDLLQIANHVFFMTALLFVAHQNALNADVLRSQTVFVAQALNLQPRTPPPGFDPDEMTLDALDVASPTD